MAKISPTLRRTIIVSALGYFIDVFDIQLFAVLRVASLTDIGVAPERLATISGYIFNAQMFGMALGAFLWGWLGDRYGRLKALYGSILIYSLGTLACGFVHDPTTYGILRFITGFGLAGETGAATTLIAEMMSPKKRGWGITIISGFGFFGPAVAVLVSWFFEWRETYVVAGLMGFLLLILRMRLVEPLLFQKMRTSDTVRGSLRLLLQRRQALTFIRCLLIGLPFLYAWTFLNFFSLELSRDVLKTGEVFNQKICLFLFYIGATCGDIIGGALSQFLHSRRKSIIILYLFGIAVSALYLAIGPQVKFSVETLYAIYFLLGIGGGGWLLFSTIASEHFGTNIRATTTILAINLVRGFTIFTTFAFQGLSPVTTSANAAIIIGSTIYVLAFLALQRLRETHGLDMDYLEERKTSART